VLVITAAGWTLPTMIIVKGERELKMEHTAGWIICVQMKGWMGKGLMMPWSKMYYFHTRRRNAA